MNENLKPTVYRRINLRKYIVASVWFGCNNNCSICMLGDMKTRLAPIGFDNFRKALIHIRNGGVFDNLILSGAEVTTFPDLDRYVDYAVSLCWFKKIQVQTNGRRLSDHAYLDHLIGRGVNEFFISIHGFEKVHDSVAQVPGAFREIMTALDHLESRSANVITNTVVTKTNLRELPGLIAYLSQRRISEIHLWNFFPMERRDSRDLIVALKEFVPLLPGLLSTMKRASKALVLKSFPQCLSPGEPLFFDSLFPGTVLPEAFWKEFQDCGFRACVHKDLCSARECWGLSSAHIDKYGDEREFLKPIRS
jgi:sulfatase maturation enzyme AslB (radical SAM superfamily)